MKPQSVVPVLLALVVLASHAQPRGEADESESHAPKAKPTTAAERADARKKRQASNVDVSRNAMPAEGDSKPAATGARYSAKERETARTQRRADTAAANKAGTIPRLDEGSMQPAR